MGMQCVHSVPIVSLVSLIILTNSVFTYLIYIYIWLGTCFIEFNIFFCCKLKNKMLDLN